MDSNKKPMKASCAWMITGFAGSKLQVGQVIRGSARVNVPSHELNSTTVVSSVRVPDARVHQTLPSCVCDRTAPNFCTTLQETHKLLLASRAVSCISHHNSMSLILEIEHRFFFCCWLPAKHVACPHILLSFLCFLHVLMSFLLRILDSLPVSLSDSSARARSLLVRICFCRM